MRRRLAWAAVGLAWAAASGAQVTVVAAGDIACDPADVDFRGGAGSASRCRQRSTSDLALALEPDAVLLLGDNQYESGKLAAYRASFDPSWGRLGSLLRPAPGNHEYLTPGAAGYFDYFGAAAGSGRYSFDLGGWHLVSLDSNCAQIGGCGVGSPEETWLRQDLAANAGRCTLAYWHHPRFSSGQHGNDASYTALWQALYDAGADLVLTGHDHDYERFAPQDASGRFDPERGLREFVVGTGGKDQRPFATLRANSQARRSDRLGVLWLRLYSSGYDWRFVGEAGEVLDAGSAACHGPEAGSALSLAAGRFRVEVDWQDGRGGRGVAQPGPAASPAAGVLWFFDPSNWEMLVKIVDGCAVNGHRWLFASAATNVGFTLRAMDTQSGRVYEFTNPPGQVPVPLQATQAFPCP
jgi:hypothetical protein